MSGKKSGAYYNEIDLHAAQWLRNLIVAGHIAPGVVDTRSIEDVTPADLREFSQCHFFTGIGVWSYSLRRAGWPDDRSVWTGSCPCQPFSTAGKGAGFADERHLWPAFHHIIKECRPQCVIGEQVASKDSESWIDLVQADLEALGYAIGAVPFPSAGVGAPHIRDRLYWSAVVGVGQPDANNAGLERRRRVSKRATKFTAGSSCMAGGLADSSEIKRGRRTDNGALLGNGAAAGRNEITGDTERDSSIDRPGTTSGFWRDADWLGCRDGKSRPVEPGAFPLAHGASGRVGRLRAYGNAINASAATVWIESVMESIQ